MEEEVRFGKNAHQERLLGFWAGLFVQSMLLKLSFSYNISISHGLFSHREQLGATWELFSSCVLFGCFLNTPFLQDLNESLHFSVFIILLRLIDVHNWVVKAKEGVQLRSSSHLKPRNVQLAQADKTVETSIVHGLNGCSQRLASVHFVRKFHITQTQRWYGRERE